MNPFEEFVEGSNPIQDGLAAIQARESRREDNAQSYVASIEDLKEEMKAMEVAFRDIVYSYSALLPDGWRATGDFDKWLAGKACAGFVQGGMKPSSKLMIGGGCETVREIELELERLYAYLVGK